VLALVMASGSAGATAAGNLARAQRESARLLSLLQLPSDAMASASEPRGDHGVLAQPGYDEATPNLVDDHGWWTAPGNASDVLAYVTSHLPPDAKRYATGSGNIAPGYQTESFSLPPIGGVLGQRVLAVTVVQLDRHTTGVRTDGEAVWIVPRPGWERIPGGVRQVVVTVDRQTSPGRQGALTAPRTLTGNNARRLVTFINRLGIVQPGARNCPAEFLLTVHLRFVGHGGRTLATAVEHPTGCAYLDLRIAGRRGPPLADLPSVSSELARLGAG
jgi:hypothetical protein